MHFRGILCDLELQESKQETRYRPGKSKGAGSPTLATRPHFKPCSVEWFSIGKLTTRKQSLQFNVGSEPRHHYTLNNF